MEKIQLNIAALQAQYPRAWKDFEDFKHELDQLYEFNDPVPFEQYPFEYQLGIFFRYFKDNGMELDICNVDLELVPTIIEENFKGHNQAVAHYS